MKNRAIEKSERKTFFEIVSRLTEGQQVEIEVAGLDVGDQIEENWAQLLGLSFDSKDNTLYVDSPAFEHAIRNPSDIISVQDDQTISAIYIKDGEGHVQSLKFRNPLMLAAPERHAGPNEF